MMGFIRQLVLPKEVDFNASLLEQAQIGRTMIEQLSRACAGNDPDSLRALDESASRAGQLKARNMAELLDVFIAPYDKESIYRMITQLDWICLSVKHFRIEMTSFGVQGFSECEPILTALADMATALEDGIAHLAALPLDAMEAKIEDLRRLYDDLVTLCAAAVSAIADHDDYKRLFREASLVSQLRDVGRHLYVAANTLEDMAIKVV